MRNAATDGAGSRLRRRVQGCIKAFAGRRYRCM